MSIRLLRATKKIHALITLKIDEIRAIVLLVSLKINYNGLDSKRSTNTIIINDKIP